MFRKTITNLQTGLVEGGGYFDYNDNCVAKKNLRTLKHYDTDGGLNVN